MTTNHDNFLYFPKLSTWLCSLTDVPVITGSQTVPVITFIKLSLWKTNKKKISLCRYVFLYLKTYKVLKTDKILFRLHLFLCQICWSLTYKDGSQQFDSVFYLCLVIQKSLSLCVTEVCVFCACLWVCTRQYVHEWLIWRVVLPIEWTQCYRSGKAESHVLKKEKITACN